MTGLLVVVLVAVLVLLMVIVRRRPAPAPAFDEAALRRLLADAVQPTDRPESKTSTDRSVEDGARVAAAVTQAAESDERERAAAVADTARMRAEAAAAVEAAQQERRRAREEADRARASASADAQRLVAQAGSEVQTLRSGLEDERRRLRDQIAGELEQDRRDLERTERRLQDATDALAEAQRSALHEQERVGADRRALDTVRAELDQRMRVLSQENEDLQAKWNALDQRARDLDQAAAAQETELTRVSGLTVEDARAELLARQEHVVRRDMALMTRRIEREAEADAKQKARVIVADAIQRVASDQTAQTVVSVLHLPNDEVKGRIIGREGRNIRAFETVTGVNVIIDDTPEAVLLSCFDPVRREIGRITLQMLIDDGRIHPHRIEEAYERARDEVDVLCRRAAEDAVLAVDLDDLHPELMYLVGRLKYRTSYGQNVLGHLVETAHIARGLAQELGIDPTVVTRGAFLHDIGKALTHEAQGSHALVGAELARKYGESDDVAHCIEAHHDEVAPATVEAVLTQAADSCSGGRPGARRESLENYVQRLERIEAIANAKKGVEKVFAMQAGRELRVMVKPDVVDDLEAHILAREVAKQIEEELTYPGQVRVTVIRESRATEIAR
ncbi:ribonuclease Y [Nakamurella flavida]|uniref:Ribonuclease Y n=1 Tax=Nakamurella flavida TaxID=363630 RepID=A0A938YPH4_9ACTN|nr:ribonuclease Y [Nakamurella flavida]MBM9478316.1 ribonuclease Y [Nakamurella flavida]MDP9777513.1 ribonuclease Y [Nakamurella flavida]